jgi:LDH2 family malate/lactate/ureidoglycolate dehydrogenase
MSPPSESFGDRSLDAATLRRAVAGALEEHAVVAFDAAVAAEVMVEAEVRGIAAHGIRRVPRWIAELRAHTVVGRRTSRVLRQSPTAIFSDAGNGLGYAPARVTMEWVVDAALTSGAAFGVLRNTNDFGLAGYYARIASRKLAIGIVGTNAPRSVVPTFARDPLLGPNPLAVAVPADREPGFVLDFSTAGIGGAGTESGGHKGYGLGLLVDILTGVWGGGPFGPDLGTEGDAARGGERTQFFAAFAVDGFREPAAFLADMDAELRSFSHARTAPGYERVFVPGERAEELRAAGEAAKIPVPAEVWAVISEHV